MRTPPLLIGAALLLWGWQQGLIYPALVMALVLEVAPLVKIRWEVSRHGFRRITLVCLAILGALFFYFLFKEPEFIVLHVTGGLAAAFFPLVAAHVYAVSDTVDIDNLFPRFGGKNIKRYPKKNLIHLSYPYFALCLLSACANYQIRRLHFLIILFLLLAWAAWKIRPKRYSPWTWVLLLLAAGVAGLFAFVGIAYMNSILGRTLFGGYTTSRPPAADQRGTAIGRWGKLEESDTILFRLQPPPGGVDNTYLLREQTFDIYGSAVWSASSRAYRTVPPGSGPGEWQPAPASPGGETVTIISDLPDGEGLLRLPSGAFRLEALPVAGVMKNAFGAVKVSGGPGFIQHRAVFHKGENYDTPPGKFDLRVPRKERDHVEQVVRQLELVGKSPGEIVDRIQRFFGDNFTYSLVTSGKGRSTSALAQFLLKSRSGHCEYFATATVLLLRAAGVPARYVYGFSAHEYSELEKRIVVREKHAHAWTLVYLGGGWVTLDTTPSLPGLTGGGGIGQWLADVYAYLKFKVLEWRWKLFKGSWLPLVLLLSFILVFWFYRRVLRKRMKKVVPTAPTETEAIPEPMQKAIAEFHELEEKMKTLGFERGPGETRSAWLKRIETAFPAPFDAQAPGIIIDLHYRDRFGAKKTAQDEIQELKSRIKGLLERVEDYTGKTLKP